MISEVIYIEYFSCLLEGDKSKCAAILAHLFEQKISLKELYVKLFQRSLYSLGKWWELNKICVATEHNAVAISECLLNFTYPIVSSTPKNGMKAVITCVQKEFHQVGAKIAADILEYNGWETFFLGANTPLNELYKIIENKKPDLLGYSVSTYINIKRLFDSIDKTRSKYPDLNIIVGGQIIDESVQKSLLTFPKVTYINDLTALEHYGNKFILQKQE